MKYKYFVGIDVSKLFVDVALVSSTEDQTIFHEQFENSAKGITVLLNWLRSIHAASISESVICMEATGLYCNLLLEQLQEQGASLWVENAVQIKRSMGVVRGKNDKMDAIRIARYALRNQDRIRLWRPAGDTINKIKNLASLRERLVDTQKRLSRPINDLREAGDTAMAKLLEKTIKKSIDAIEKDLKKVEDEIHSIIAKDEQLNKVFGLITSVVGIGFVTAVNLIIHTHGFAILNDTRKLSCYCGVAPFPYQSGISIKGRTRVHAMANKKLKTNLHMASLTAVKLDPELKLYYERKVQEGKNKMSVLNAVRNKLLARVVAVVNKQEFYVKKLA